jgi:predicted O-linked N-acetylglucosamine transferase (SPINDLY family)
MPADRPWVALFLNGDRLKAEVCLHAARLRGTPAEQVEADLRQLHRAAGRLVEAQVDGAKALALGSAEGLQALELAYRAAGTDLEALQALIQATPEYPDPLLLWAISQALPSAPDRAERRARLRRLGLLLLRQFPQRLDLLLALVAAEGAMDVLKSLPDCPAPASTFYTSTQPALMHLQSLWAKGRYEQLLLTYAHYLLQRRWFPSSDYILRCYTMVGAIDRVDRLFRAIYQRHTAELVPATLSNMLFTALGLEQLDQGHVEQLVQHWRRLTRPAQVLPARPLSVQERPTVVVVSADLRMHPVGRFWLPIARAVQQRFRLVHLGFNPHDSDGVRDQLQQCSDEWHLLDASDATGIDALLRRCQPELLLDLGGHTADNLPALLNQRYAPVQATYLGFFGPSYGEQCDWWILDPAIARRVRQSYPGSEAIWELPCSSLCYDPTSHGLPSVETIVYSEPDHPVIGSFNHTRKLTDVCIARFGQVLSAMPEAVLQFRSHSFFDPAVRRWFLRQFLEAGIAAEQLQPLPYAPSGADALTDYGRIHLHLDSYPVSGTTTTLDALAMGIPVLTCPNHLYAGAISAAILENAGLAEMVCEQPAELPRRAAELVQRYRTAQARRQLAAAVRASPLCNTQAMPRLFAAELARMLQAASLRSA